MSSITLETPLAESLSNNVHAKIVEQGWTQEDDTSLAEYIVLMLANGKTQDQIASELAGELLQDASGTEEFSQWLFEQVAALTGESTNTGDNATVAQMSGTQSNQDDSIPAAYDMDMGDTAPDNAPRGPKGLHGGRAGGRAGRGGSQNKTDSVLHRTRGNDRINSHVRGAPKGPRGGREVRPGMQKALNGMMGAQQQQGQQSPTGQNPMLQNGSQQGMMSMSPQQQMEFMAMMEQQARMMAQFMPGMVQGMGNNNFGQNGQQQSGGSLFDRVQPGRGRGGARGRGRGGAQQNGAARKASDEKAVEDGQQGDASSQMDTDGNGPASSADPATTICYYNLRCTNKNCQYVHQSPVAPDGVTIDLSDTCSFGAACKNPKCVGKHPSPATIRAHQAEEMCKFFPRCQNPVCPFKHPTMPLCSFGASCKNKDCRFTHLNTPCRFNPCTNPTCPYKHEDGQNKTFSDFQWTADGAKKDDGPDHVSNRKFVEDEGAEEELVKAEAEGQQQAAEVGST